MVSMKERFALIGAVVLFVITISFLSFFVFITDPRFLTFSGFFVFYSTLFLSLWSFGYIISRFIVRKRRRVPDGLVRRNIVISCIIISAIVLSQMRLMSVYVILVLVVFGVGIEYYLHNKR